jgi:hypothetical protein
MRWPKFFSVPPKKSPIWAALCTGRADGSNPKYLARVKHPILVMVRTTELDAQSAIYSLLQSNGWREPEIQRVKILNEPFDSEDPIMNACYERAIKNEGGIVVYSDPIEET